MEHLEANQRGQFEAYLPRLQERQPDVSLSTNGVEDNTERLWRRVAGSVAAVAVTAGLAMAPQMAEAFDHDDEAIVATDTERAERPLRICPAIKAHRGSVGKMRKPGKDFTTENTVWAARRAEMWGADGLEYDNRDSAEDPTTGQEEVFVIHDGTVDRTFPGWHGKVENKTPQQLMRMRTRDGSTIPVSSTGDFLRDVLSTGWTQTRHRAQRLTTNILNLHHQIEIKRVSNLRKFVDTVHEVIREKQHVNPSDVIMWTTDKRRVAQRLHQLDPTAEFGRIYFSGRPSDKLISNLTSGRTMFTSFNVHEATIRQSWVMAARRKGMDVLARTVNDVATAKRVINAGVTHIVTDNVPKVNAWNLDRLNICRAVRKNMPVITPPEPTPTPTPTPTPIETPTSAPTETAATSEPVQPSPSDTAILSEVSTTPTEPITTVSLTPTATATP